MSRIENDLDQLKEMTSVLNEDEQRCYQNGRLYGDDSEFWRRMLVRAFFAQLEGTVYRMRQLAETAAPRFAPDSLNNKDRAWISDKKYDKASDSVVTATKWRNTKQLIPFAFDVFARSHGASYTIDTGSETKPWTALVRSIDVRDRLMHPKSRLDLLVRDCEVEDLKTASKWFATKVKEVRDTVRASLLGHMN